MVNLGSNHDSGSKLSPDLETIKAGRRGDGANGSPFGLVDFRRPTLSDPIDVNGHRRTQDWKFPSITPSASADINLYRFPSYEPPPVAMTPESNYSAALVDHPMEIIGHGIQDSPALSQQTNGRYSIADSLIDLDMGFPDSLTELFRPSTGGPDIGSPTGEQKASGSHFELEREASLCQPFPAYQNLAEVSDFSASDTEGKTMHSFRNEAGNYQGSVNSDYTSMPPSQGASQRLSLRRPDQVYTMAHFPDIPAPPSLAAMTGKASDSELLSEMVRLLGGLTGQLGAFHDVCKSLYYREDNMRV